MSTRGSVVYDYTGVVIYIFFFFQKKGVERKRERDREGESGGEEWRKRRTGDARDISNFLITPRGANDLPLARPSHPPLISPAFSASLPFRPVSSFSLRPSSRLFYLTQILRATDTTWRHSTPPITSPQSPSSISHQPAIRVNPSCIYY